jgi:hypothetical protein
MAAIKEALGGENNEMVTLVRKTTNHNKCTKGLANFMDAANSEKASSLSFYRTYYNPVF